MVIPQAVVALPIASSLKNSHHYRVLVVDDNVDLAQTILWSLEMVGHTVQMAHDGPTAIALAKSFLPDVIYLDIGMPEMNGYEICQALREEPVLENTVIIAQTGWGQKEHRTRTKEAGFDYHLVKPVDIGELESLLRSLRKVAA